MKITVMPWAPPNEKLYTLIKKAHTYYVCVRRVGSFMNSYYRLVEKQEDMNIKKKKNHSHTFSVSKFI